MTGFIKGEQMNNDPNESVPWGDFSERLKLEKKSEKVFKELYDEIDKLKRPMNRLLPR